MTLAPAPQWLLDRLERPAERASAPAVVAPDDDAALARAAHYLAHEAAPAIQGDHGDQTTYEAAAKLRDFGLSEPAALDIMLTHYNERCSPPWAPNELAVKVRNAYAYGQNPIGHASPAADFSPVAPPAQKGIAPNPVFPFDWRDLPRRRWLFGNVTIAGKVTEIIAPPGAGKSTLTIGIAMSCASGKPLLGIPVHLRHAVAIYNNEDDREEILRRHGAYAFHHGLTEADFKSADGRPLLFANSGEHHALTIAMRVGTANLTHIKESPEVESLVGHLRANNIRTLIVDPFIETHPAKENDNVEIAQVAAIYRSIAQRADCAVVLVHHTRKLPAGSSDGHAGNMDSSRGASSILGIARVVRTFYSMDAKAAKRYGLRESDRHLYVGLDDAKANLSLNTGKTQWFKRTSVRLPTWDVDGTDGAALAGEDGRRIGFESVGILEPIELVEMEDDKMRLHWGMAQAIADVMTMGKMKLGDVARRLIDRDPMLKGQKVDTVKRQIWDALAEPIQFGSIQIGREQLQKNHSHSTRVVVKTTWDDIPKESQIPPTTQGTDIFE